MYSFGTAIITIPLCIINERECNRGKGRKGEALVRWGFSGDDLIWSSSGAHQSFSETYSFTLIMLSLQHNQVWSLPSHSFLFFSLLSYTDITNERSGGWCEEYRKEVPRPRLQRWSVLMINLGSKRYTDPHLWSFLISTPFFFCFCETQWLTHLDRMPAGTQYARDVVEVAWHILPRDEWSLNVASRRRGGTVSFYQILPTLHILLFFFLFSFFFSLSFFFFHLPIYYLFCLIV